MNKKITIKDIAKEAGVSVATVSYVLNDRCVEKRISEETKKKVLQIVNLMNYAPNSTAQALATSSIQSVALCFSPDESVLKQAQQMRFLNAFSLSLQKKNIRLSYLSAACTDRIQHVDAIICQDIETELFHSVGDNNFVPLIAVDCQINDPIFYQVTLDFAALSQKACAYFKTAPFVYATLPITNTKQRLYVESCFEHICYVESSASLSGLCGKNIVTTQSVLAELLSGENLYFLSPDDLLFDKVTECIEAVVNRIFIENHDIKL